MWCPSNWFLPWEVQSFCLEAASLVHSVYLSANRGKKGFGETYLSRSEDLFADYLFCGILSSHGAHVCSKNGQVFRVGGPLTHLENSPFSYRWDYPYHSKSGLSQIYKTYLSDPNYTALAHFDFIDMVTGTINAGPTRTEELLRIGESRGEDLSETIEIAKSFHGWALCFDSDVVPYDPEKILIELGLRHEASAVQKRIEHKRKMNESEPDSARQALTRVQRSALAAYNKAFPGGRNSATWREIEHRTGYSKSTLWRALQIAGVDEQPD